jgi:hypothetical protein
MRYVLRWQHYFFYLSHLSFSPQQTVLERISNWVFQNVDGFSQQMFRAQRVA